MSLRQAVNEHCKNCIYDPQSGLGTWRQQVEACTVTECAIWPHRPKSKKRNPNPGEQPLALKRWQNAVKKRESGHDEGVS